MLNYGDTTQISRLCVIVLSLKCFMDNLKNWRNWKRSPAERNRADVKVKRREFEEWLNNVRDDHDHKLIYIDEAGFNLHMCRTRGRAAPGDRAVRVVNGRRGNVKFSIFHFLVFMYMQLTLGPNTTCILAVSVIRGIIHQEFRQGGVTAGIFNAFMQRTV